MSTSLESFPYDVALSFAGQDRDYVDAVARFLAERGTAVFYDEFEQVNLWGKDLIIYLDEVYRTKARYCVIFISRHYAASLWASHEVRSAFSRAFKEHGEYILPVRFDDTEIPGMHATVAYIDARNRGPEFVGELIRQKLDGQTRMNDGDASTLRGGGSLVRVLVAAFIAILGQTAPSPARAIRMVDTRSSANANVDGEDLTLAVRIRLRWSQTDIPVLNRHVIIHRYGEVSGEYISDINGEVISNLAPGHYVVVIDGPGGRRMDFEVSPSSTSLVVELGDLLR